MKSNEQFIHIQGVGHEVSVRPSAITAFFPETLFSKTNAFIEGYAVRILTLGGPAVIRVESEDEQLKVLALLDERLA